MSSELDLAVLKGMLSSKKNSVDFASQNSHELFSPEVWVFAKHAVEYIKVYKDSPTLKVLVERATKGNNEREVENLKKIWTEVEFTQIDLKEHLFNIDKMKKRFAEKQILSIKETLSKIDSGKFDIKKVLEDFKKTTESIRSLSQAKAYERKTLKEALPTFREEYMAKQSDDKFDAGIKTGYSVFDDVTGGLRPGELILIGGESGAGKSMLLMNMAIQIWLQENTIEQTNNFKPGVDVLYFSLEMPFKPCLNRVLGRLARCPSKNIRNATLNPTDGDKLKKALRFIDRYPNQFEIIDIPRGATMEYLERLFEDAKANFDPKVIVIDYLGLMDYEGGEMDDWLKLGKISEKIHEFARAQNVTVLSAVQLNRAKAGKDLEEKIGMHRIGRSALIMTNANIAIQIETRQNEKQYPNMVNHLIKNRDGALEQFSIIKDLACGTLLDDPIAKDDSTEFTMRDPDDISYKLDMMDF